MMKILRCISALALAILLAAPCATAYTDHKVKKGETLWGVAYKYGITADDIVRANPHAKNGLKNGMLLRIPDKQDLAALESADQSQTPQVSDSQPANTVPSQPQQTAQPQQQPQQAAQPQQTAPDEDEPAVPVNPVSVPDNIYIAKFGDTLHSVSIKTGISETRLLAYNPLVDSKHIPEGYPVRLAEDAPYLAPASDISLVDSIVYRIKPADEVADNPAVTQLTSDELTVAVMLPFDADGETISRQSLLATDFYKGLLLSAKNALDRERFPLKIIAVDTQCDEANFDRQLSDLIRRGVSVIIPPEDEAQLEKVQTAALQNGITVINALNVKDEGYLKYPNVVQCNISQKLMYDKAIGALMSDFADYTPVILDLSGGKDEKMSFIEELRRQYSEAGKKVIDLSFTNMLTAEDLKALPASGKFIFIPKSGSADVFNKFSDALSTLINENYTDQTYKLFGYPDWITFKGEQEEALHNMGATIYSRFFMDADDPATDSVNQDFIKWYGYQMEEVYPSQGMLGYDIGTMIFSKLKNTDKADVNRALQRGRFVGKQSSFRFVEPDDATGSTPGMVNDVLYLIEFLPGTFTNYKTL